MVKPSSLLLSFALCAGLASAAPAQERTIPQSLLDRYSDTLRGPDNSVRKDDECRGFKDLLSNGNIYKNMFNNGQGRTTIEVDPRDGGSIGINIELGTRGQALPAQDCSDLIP